MANSHLVQAAVTVQGTIQKSNFGGLQIDGAWYNYPRGTPKEAKLSGQVIGSLVTLAVLYADGQKPVIGSVLKLVGPEGSSGETPAAAPVPSPVVPEVEAQPAAPVAPATAPSAAPSPSWMADPVSGAQKEKIETLSASLGLSSGAVNLILKMRYKDEEKSVVSLTKSEASKLIQFLDGSAPALPSRGRSA